MFTIKHFIAIVIIMSIGMVATYRLGLQVHNSELEYEYQKGAKHMQDQIENRAERFYYQECISPRDLEIIIFGESQE